MDTRNKESFQFQSVLVFKSCKSKQLLYNGGAFRLMTDRHLSQLTWTKMLMRFVLLFTPKDPKSRENDVREAGVQSQAPRLEIQRDGPAPLGMGINRGSFWPETSFLPGDRTAEIYLNRQPDDCCKPDWRSSKCNRQLLNAQPTDDADSKDLQVHFIHLVSNFLSSTSFSQTLHEIFVCLCVCVCVCVCVCACACMSHFSELFAGLQLRVTDFLLSAVHFSLLQIWLHTPG